MHVVCVVGGSVASRSRVVEALVERLGERGSVATVTDAAAAGDSSSSRPRGAAETYELGADGEWAATGSSLSLDDALERLAPRHDYAVLDGHSGRSLPTIVLGDEDTTVQELVLERESDPEKLDYEKLVASLDDAEPYYTLESLVADAKRSEHADRSGAIATFTGRVRAKDAPDDVETTHLEFEKYEGVAEERMASLREDLEARDGVYDVRLHHRTGVLEAGEDIVFVVVLAGHRREAFRTVEAGIDRLKDEVPLFKKEVTVEDEFWRHDRPTK